MIDYRILLYLFDMLMQRSEKQKSFSTRKAQQKSLPTLKSTALTGKGMFSISKVDIDSRAICRQQPPMRTTTTGPFQREHQRSQSGFGQRKNKDTSTTVDVKVVPRMQVDQSIHSSFKLQLRDIREETEQPTLAQTFTIERSKVSSRSYGAIQGYSANSHPGPLLSYNQDRICIVTNLTKTSSKSRQVSFFGVYDGTDGTSRADHMRDNYHLLLLEDECFPSDLDTAMKRTLRKLINNFQDDPKYTNDESSVSFSILVILGDEVHYLQSGNCKAVFSQNLGANIITPYRSEIAMISREISKKSKSVAQLLKRGSKHNRQILELQYRRFLIGEDGLDFILLGSEGVFENIKPRDIGRKLWLNILKNRQQNIHLALGESNNALLTQIFSGASTKNASIIIIAFMGVGECIGLTWQGEQLKLPYISKV